MKATEDRQPFLLLISSFDRVQIVIERASGIRLPDAR